MSEVAQNAAQAEIDSFKSDIEKARQEHGALIAELEAELIPVTYEYSEKFMEFTDELSDALGAEAANACEKNADQDDAIGLCEKYVSNEVTSDSMSLVVACVAFHGPEKARNVIGSIVSESPLIRAGAGLGR